MKIIEIRLKTGGLDKQKTFYQNVLGLPLLEDSSNTLTFQAGASRLVFEQETGFPSIYHFAFDIPENQIEQARTWLAPRVPITRNGDSDIVHFANWNAHSLYFFDPAGNVLELIARHNQPNASQQPFDEHSIISVSEIGLVTGDVPATVTALHSALGLEVYNGPAGDEFAAVGDEQGLLIVVKRGRIWFSSRSSPADFWPLSITIAGHTHQDVTLEGLPYRIHTQPEEP